MRSTACSTTVACADSTGVRGATQAHSPVLLLWVQATSSTAHRWRRHSRRTMQLCKLAATTPDQLTAELMCDESHIQMAAAHSTHAYLCLCSHRHVSLTSDDCKQIKLSGPEARPSRVLRAPHNPSRHQHHTPSHPQDPPASHNPAQHSAACHRLLLVPAGQHNRCAVYVRHQTCTELPIALTHCTHA
jgi:hypothetical protein